MSEEIKKIKKYYKKYLFSTLNKNIFVGDNFLTYFICYLRYLRDISIVVSDDISTYFDDYIATTLFYSICEFDESQTCFSKYFNEDGTQIDRKKKKKKIIEQYTKEKEEHLDNFFKVVSENLQSWVEIYGD